MFLKQLNRDFTDLEVRKYLNPHYKMVCKYLETYIVPEMISYYLASGYHNSLMFEEDFNIHIVSIMSELFNYEIKDLKATKQRIREILNIKYNLVIVCERPLKFKEKIL